MTNIIKKVKDANLETIELLFTDVLGQLKGFDLSVTELARALDEGIGFDGSSVDGFARIEESDLLLKPDPDSFFLFPADKNGSASGVIICDVLHPNGEVYESDPRAVLKKIIDKAENMGFDHYYVGPELEYFYFLSNKEVVHTDLSGYFEVLGEERVAKSKKEVFSILTKFGIQIEITHHEVAFSQHEIDFRYNDALRIADYIMITKKVVKESAFRNGLYATFLPKPIFGINGSGMHVHQSLFTGDTNAFYSSNDVYNLSDTGKQFIAGLLKYSKQITAITSQWVNSYKRLVVGYEAPVYICWGRRNRSALVRVPAFKPYRPQSCRIEYRAPDPAANPYLCFAVMLAAGLKGIEEKLILPEPVEKDVYAMLPEMKAEYGIDSLPDSLYTAIVEMENSELVKNTLGEILFNKFIQNKRTEWEKYRVQVTDYEIKTYLPML